MKKFVIIFLMLIMLFGFASAEMEIEFASIPWLSDEYVASKALTDVGYLREGVEIPPMNNDGGVYIIENDNLLMPYFPQEREIPCYSMDFAGINKGKIAGYAVDSILFSFAYDGSFKLISVKVNLLNGDYNDIIQKMTRVYGEGELKRTEEQIETIMWKGTENTCVLLHTQNDGKEFILLYGRLDAEDILNNCTIADPADESGL